MILGADDFSFWDFLLWSLWIFLLMMFFWALIGVWADLFTRHDINGFAKTLWFLFTLFVPILGLLIYMISQGDGAAKRAAEKAKARGEMMASMAPPASTTDELTKLGQLRADGTITQAEFDSMKAKLLT